MSRDGFFRSGVTKACFRESGKIPMVNDRLTILVITGERLSTHCFKSVIGIGSRVHCLLADFKIISFISHSVTGEKSRSSLVAEKLLKRRVFDDWELETDALRLVIFEEKKVENSSGRISGDFEGKTGGGER